MKKISIIILALAAAFSFTGCLKDTPNTDFSGLKPTVEISTSSTNSTPNAPSAGREFFSQATLLFPSATNPLKVYFTVNLASVDAMGKDIAVTVDADDAARVTYNNRKPANAGDTLKYTAFTSDQYAFSKKVGTIRAGKRIDTIFITFDPTKIDLKQNWMLAVSIKDASGLAISGNFGTIYYHVIGNPLAGSYRWDFTRWNNADGSGAPSSLSFTGKSTTFVPIGPTTIQVASGYYIQPRYELSFKSSGGTLSNFSVKLNDADVKAMSDAGVTVTSGPNILNADPVNKVFEFQYVVSTGSANRYIKDKYYP